MIQPPSEIPCNPYITRHNLSLSMECVVALPKADHDHLATIHWREKIGDNEDHLLREDTSMPYSGDENNKLLRSVLHLKDEVTFHVRKYWCELNFDEPSRNTTISNIATVNPPKYYSSLPPCHRDTVFHLAERACAEMGQSLGSPFPSPSPMMTSHCSSGNESESSGPSSLNTMVLTTVAVGIGVPIILATMLLIAALTILLVRKKRRKGDIEEHTSKPHYLCTPTECVSRYMYICITMCLKLYAYTVH